MTVGKRIKRLRETLGISQVDFAEKIGASKQTLYKYENDIITNVPSDKVEAAAKLLNVSPSYLMGWEDCDGITPPDNHKVTINIYGHVAAGIPLEMITDIIDTEDITEDMAKTGTFFGLKIKGDSMIPNICNDDIVIVRQQDDAENGDTVIAQINGDEATCKRLRKYKDGIELIANNPNYEPMFFSNEQIINKPVRILGKVVELRRSF